MAIGDLLAAFEIVEIGPGQVIRRPRETKAVRTLERIARRRGEGHVSAILTILCETHPGSAFAIIQDVITAVGDVLDLLGDRMDGDTLARFDAIDLAETFRRATLAGNMAPRRHVMSTIIADRLGLLGPPMRSPVPALDIAA
jgi:hypothetical protein